MLTNKQFHFLKKVGVINGCGKKGGFSFSSFFRFIIKKLPEFLEELGESYFRSVERKACGPHDVRYTLGGTIFDKIAADFEFACNIFKVTRWTFILFRIFLFLICFVGLLILGNSAFNFGKKKDFTKFLKSLGYKNIKT